MDYINQSDPAYTKIEDYAELTTIQKFYSGTNILITGGTGFLGKLLIDKLLRSCPTLSTLYLLVRNKKGKNMDERVEELFDDPVFDRLRELNPKFLHKIIGISGDCSLPELGLSLQDRRLLIDEISVVFHVAATVKFDEKVKLATYINVRAPQDLLILGQKMQNLKSFIHVSTAYANCTDTMISETIYPPAVDSTHMVKLAETVSDQILDSITPTLLGKYPNTYAFTKQIAEDIVRKEGQNLPVGIFRPSIVISTYKEPIKGWINNMYGPTGVTAGAGTGLIRTLHCDPDVNANMVPADMVVNSLIACAWEVSELYKECKRENRNYDIKVYNYESSKDKPIDWKTYMHLTKKYGFQYPTSKAIWYYCFTLYKSNIMYLLSLFFLHYVPAVMVDFILVCVGKKARMLKLYKKINKFCSVIAFFSLRNFVFNSNNIHRLLDKMSNEDKELFLFDLQELNWDEYFMEYGKGVREYLIKDPITSLPEAREKWRRLYFAHQTLKVVVIFLLLRFLWSLISFGLTLTS